MSSFLVGRTRARSQAIQIIFQSEFQHKDVYDVVEDGSYVLDDGPADPYAIQLAKGVAKSRIAIDALLASVSQNWNLSRMPLVDRVIMAIAVHEMFDEQDVPVSVAISEAVEIAKVYGADDSSVFINGILGRIARLAEAHPEVSMAHLVDYASESAEQTAQAAQQAKQDDLSGETPLFLDQEADQEVGEESRPQDLTAESDANGGQ